MKKIVLLFLFCIIIFSTLNSFAKPTFCSSRQRSSNVNKIELFYSAGVPVFQREVSVNGLTNRFEQGAFSNYGINCYFALTYNTGVSLGIGKSNWKYQQITEGVFKSSGLYGKINHTYSPSYLTIPVSFSWQIDRYFKLNVGYKGGYNLQQYKTTTLYGGAENSDLSESIFSDINWQSAAFVGLEWSKRITSNCFISVQPTISYCWGFSSEISHINYKPILPMLTLALQFGEINWNFLSDYHDNLQNKKDAKSEKLELRKKEIETKIDNQINNH